MKKIPFFNYPYIFKQHKKEYLKIFEEVMSCGSYILQKDLEEFEKNLAKFIKVKHAFGVANGTDAIVLALRAAGVKPGDEVILPSHTFIATAAAVHFVGAKPILVECGRDHMLDPKSAEAAVTNKTTCIIPVQLNGRTCDMDAVQKIADKHNLIIVEDAAQALGSRFKDKYAGTFGLAGAFSFYPAKALGCFGDGGAVVTNDDKMAEKIYLMRDHGRNKDGEVVMWGVNSRLDNLQAAILKFKLSKYDKEIKRRREIANLYSEGLEKIKELILPPASDSDNDHFDIFQNYEIEAEKRDELKTFLSKKGVGTLIQWGGKAVHQYEKLGFKVKLPYTEKMFTRCLMLPMNTSLADEDICYICNSIKQFYGYN